MVSHTPEGATVPLINGKMQRFNNHCLTIQKLRWGIALRVT